MSGRSLLAVSLAALVAGCGPFDGIDGSSEELADAVYEAGATGRPLRLAEATSFEWDRVHVFGPYTPASEIERSLGFRWGGANDSEISTSDVMALVVFVRDGEVVKAFEQGYGDGIFDCLDRRTLGRNGLTPTQAVLPVQRTRRDGQTFDVVLPGPALEARARRCYAAGIL